MFAGWVTVETFWSVEQAQMARNLLEAAGIPCQLDGLATASTMWHLGNATGGVKLLVPAEDEDRADLLLEEAENRIRESLDADDGLEENWNEVENEVDREDAESPAFERLGGGSQDGGEHHEEEEYSGVLDRFRAAKWIIWLWFFPAAVAILSGIVAVVMMILSWLFRW